MIKGYGYCLLGYWLSIQSPVLLSQTDTTMINVALAENGASVSASDYMRGNEPDQLIDGVTNHSVANRWHSDPGVQHPHRLTFSLPQAFTIKSIVLQATVPNCFPTRLRILYSGSDKILKELPVRTIQPEMTVTMDLDPIVADQIQIELLESSNLSAPQYSQLNEIEIWAQVTPEQKTRLDAWKQKTQEALRQAKLNELYMVPSLEPDYHCIQLG